MDFRDCLKFASDNPNVEVCFYHVSDDMMAENIREEEIPRIRF